MAHTIKNCEFAYKCPMKWAELTLTDVENIRSCQQCHKPVVFCRTESELEQAVKNRDCVAIQIESLTTMGVLAPPSPENDNYP